MLHVLADQYLDGTLSNSWFSLVVCELPDCEEGRMEITVSTGSQYAAVETTWDELVIKARDNVLLSFGWRHWDTLTARSVLVESVDDRSIGLRFLPIGRLTIEGEVAIEGYLCWRGTRRKARSHGAVLRCIGDALIAQAR